MPAGAPPYSPRLIGFCRVVVGVAWPWFGRWQATGFDRVPAEGPAILAANHTSYLDPILLARAIRRPVYFMAWKQLFAHPTFARVIGHMGAIPLDSEKGIDRGAFALAVDLLRAGQVVAIFPEGIRGWDGRLNPLRPGVGRLAVAGRAPIFPVWIEGALQALPRWERYPRPFVPLSVDCGEPLTPAQHHGHGHRRRHEADHLRHRLTTALQELARARAARAR